MTQYWVLFELLWRDYMRFAGLRWGPKLFYLWGQRQLRDPGRVWRTDDRILSAWCCGHTGYPFVDGV